MNACEWSLLLGYAPAVTIHYINEGIDTGEVFQIIPVPVEPGDNVDLMRDKCVAIGIIGLLEVLASMDRIKPKRLKDANTYRQCYVMAPVMREIAEAKLTAGCMCLHRRERKA
jgi:methionyl-tRNA formyltransferase